MTQSSIYLVVVLNCFFCVEFDKLTTTFDGFKSTLKLCLVQCNIMIPHSIVITIVIGQLWIWFLNPTSNNLIKMLNIMFYTQYLLPIDNISWNPEIFVSQQTILKHFEAIHNIIYWMYYIFRYPFHLSYIIPWYYLWYHTNIYTFILQYNISSTIILRPSTLLTGLLLHDFG